MRLNRWMVGVLAALAPTACSAPVPVAHPTAPRPAAVITAHQAAPTRSPSTRPSPTAATGAPRVTARPTITPRKGTLHYIANVGDDVSPVVALGYDLFDTGPDPETLAALPAGGKALVWLGSLDNS